MVIRGWELGLGVENLELGIFMVRNRRNIE